ncbi:Adenosylcobinamide-GDP ribazoletransferase [Candidatus Hodgkinia cicadicola]|nr:Adenosylcobinamide-GDP ribazoletransferase [Candidatus Hodgkinia cicadicola]
MKMSQLYLTSNFKPVKVIFLKKRNFRRPRSKPMSTMSAPAHTSRRIAGLMNLIVERSQLLSCVKESWFKFKTVTRSGLTLTIESLKDWFNKFKNCAALLTIIPVYNMKPTNDFMQPMLVVIGALQAFASAILLFRDTNTDLILYIAIKRLLQGCIHEDGLADVADASGKFDRLSKLTIIRDSKTGVFGTLALMMSLTIEYAVLKRVNNFEAIKIAAVCNFVSYSSLLWHWICLPHAYDSHKLVLRERSVITFLVVTAATLFLCFDWKRAFVLIVQMIVLNLWFNIWAWKTLGGKTGDTLGAIKLLSEMLSMMCLSV